MDNLTPLQRDYLHAWFRQTHSYFLTGGAALIAFHNVPRTTDDLNLFTLHETIYPETPHYVEAACKEVGATFESLRTAPSFRRYSMVRHSESTILDVVYDAVPQIHVEKESRPDGLLVDPIDEILVNKICALVGRSAPRDFFDICFLARSGYDVDAALAQASLKDAGVTPESMVFVLQGIEWPHFRIPGIPEASAGEVAAFFRAWCERLAVGLFP